MGELLGFNDVASERACLSCHGTGFLPDDPRTDRPRRSRRETRASSCTACHGPYLEWVENHGFDGRPGPGAGG